MSVASTSYGHLATPASAVLDSKDEQHRRDHPRLRLGIPARIETLGGAHPVQLLDLSQTGAKIEWPDARGMGEAVLQWLRFESFGEIVWREGDLIGVQFDTPLRPAVLFQTRQLAPSVVADSDQAASAAARAWVAGEFRSGTDG